MPVPEFSPDLLGRLRAARSIVVFTGAGVSQESGIPTFRDALSGLWTQFDPMVLATPEAFEADPALVWGWYEWRRGLVLRCRPNPAHHAIAQLQHHVPELLVVTQNVDDLHERAGSRDVIHLHGSLHAPRCHHCGAPWPVPETMPEEPQEGRRLDPPACRHCGGPVRPGVVWFGESLPQQAWLLALERAARCDLLFSIGTSSVVQPAAQLPMRARAAGACIVQVNPEPTGLESPHHDLRGPAGTLMPALLDAAWP
ncbi:MAG: NAD-dependent deacylase [Castellaniella sp.]